MNSFKGQLTVRGMVIGCVGCVIITAASTYTALKMGALPWPIVFAAIVSLFFLKALGKTTLNEANVTHTIMSAGAMVAGGLAFTIPGIWIVQAGNVSWIEMFGVALSGVILGLISSVLLRKHFIEEAALEFPIGEAAAQSLKAGNTGGSMGKKLFGAMGAAGIYTALRDSFAVIPQLFFGNVTIPGVAFGIYNSPMLLSVGFLVGTTSVLVWFIGALLGNFGIIVGGSTLGFWEISLGQSITASLGMGTMMGCGIGVIAKNILPQGIHSIKKLYSSQANAQNKTAPSASKTLHQPEFSQHKKGTGLFALGAAAAALLICFFLQLEPLVSFLVVLLSFVTCAMSAQSVGQTGIDPMEIFGLIVLLIASALSSLPYVQLFFVAGIIAVACGLAGDVMNDFKAGYTLGTSKEAQWIGQAIGGILGAIVAVSVMMILVSAYGTDAFGSQGVFVAAQANVVATMVTGIPHFPSFMIGLIGGFILYLIGLPVMMLGLGIYLPFYLSFTAFLGALIKVIFTKICAHKRNKLPPDQRPEKAKEQDESGLILASGLLGGESIVGVIVALITVTASLCG